MNKAVVSLENNKLCFTQEALDLLNAKANDRVAINYWTVNQEMTFPVIGKSEFFTDTTGGNRVTKSKTVSYRGEQNKILAIYGTKFSLEEFQPGIFKMISFVESEDSDFSEEENYLNNLNNIEINI